MRLARFSFVAVVLCGLLVVGCGKRSGSGSVTEAEPTPEWTDVPGDICQSPKEALGSRRQMVGWNGILIEGSNAFIACTRAALETAKDTSAFRTVKPHIAVIREGRHSGMNPTAPFFTRRVPIFEVGSRTWRRAVIWYASAIVHDGYHSYLHSRGKAWRGKEAERACLDLQLDALHALKAGDLWVRYLESLEADPTYQEIDESRRNWAR